MTMVDPLHLSQDPDPLPREHSEPHKLGQPQPPRQEELPQGPHQGAQCRTREHLAGARLNQVHR